MAFRSGKGTPHLCGPTDTRRSNAFAGLASALVRRESRKGGRNGAPGRVNAAFHLPRGTPHLCGPAGPETLKRSRGIRGGSRARHTSRLCVRIGAPAARTRERGVPHPENSTAFARMSRIQSWSADRPNPSCMLTTAVVLLGGNWNRTRNQVLPSCQSQPARPWTIGTGRSRVPKAFRSNQPPPPTLRCPIKLSCILTTVVVLFGRN
jgi:hypothetical protein